MMSPVFILGASRSGTTMLRLMLNAHPEFAVPGEQSYFSSLPVPAETWAEPALSEDEYEAFVTSYLDRKASTLPGMDVSAVRSAILAPTTPRTLREPYNQALTAWMTTQGKRRWAEKSPTNLFYVDVLDAMFPEAQYIHIVRDPRAVVHSMNRFAQCGDDSVINALNWRTFMDEGAALLESTVPPSRRLLVSYEALTAHPNESACEICAFLGVPFDQDMLEFHRSADTFMHPAYRKLGGINTVTKPVTDRTDRPKWVDGLSSDQIGVIESICTEAMHKYGYEATGAQASVWARIDRRLKEAYASIKRYQHRNDRFHIINYRPFERLYSLRDRLSLRLRPNIAK